MIGKILKISLMVFVIIFLFSFSLIFRNKVFVPVEEIFDSENFELTRTNDIVSCQMDCSLNDFVFHEACVGFNGCVDSPFIRDKNYCEVDSECVLDLSCCFSPCVDCFDELFCPVSNKYYSKAHSFSCNNTIFCVEKVFCRSFRMSKCIDNSCRIIR